MKAYFSIMAFICLVCITACNKDNPRSGKNIESFSFSGITDSVKVNIDQVAATIVAEVPAGTDVTKLSPVIKVSPGAIVHPASGVVQNFSSVKKYTVFAENGSRKEYTVTVSIRKGSVLGKWFMYETSSSVYDYDVILVTDTFRVANGTLPPRRFYIDFSTDSTGAALLSEGSSPQLFSYSITSDTTLQLITTTGGSGVSEFVYRFKPNSVLELGSRYDDPEVIGRYSINKLLFER